MWKSSDISLSMGAGQGHHLRYIGNGRGVTFGYDVGLSQLELFPVYEHGRAVCVFDQRLFSSPGDRLP